MYTSVDEIGGPSRDFYGAYAEASYFLTGEHRGYRRNQGRFDRTKPLENFWIVPGCVGTGAWQVAARWSYLDLNGTGDGEAGLQNDFTFGVNWYWNPNLRWMFNYIHAETRYDDNGALGDAGLATDGTAVNDIIAIRGQIDW
jgi:phosphate-selective porin OprO/OprP